MLSIDFTKLPAEVWQDNNLNVALHNEVSGVVISEEEADISLSRIDQLDGLITEDHAMGLAATRGGIDFDPALLHMDVKRTGDKTRVTFDPAELQRIKAEGVNGFRPVIINIVPIKAMLPALGLSESPGAEQLAGTTS
jgi:hypothetical protein